jgi:hypothetical protein
MTSPRRRFLKFALVTAAVPILLGAATTAGFAGTAGGSPTPTPVGTEASPTPIPISTPPGLTFDGTICYEHPPCDLWISMDHVESGPRRFAIDSADGTATAGLDYAAIRGGSITIPAGERGATFRITILPDTATEPDETFSLTVSGTLPGGPVVQRIPIVIRDGAPRR